MAISQSTNGTLSDTLKERIVVVDTSSLLVAGTHLLEILDSCEVVLPAIVVKELEEKRTHPTLGFLARDWLRLIESYRKTSPQELKVGVDLQEYSGIKLRVEPNHSNQKSLPEHLQDGSHDSTILAVAQNLRNEDLPVALLSNDMPMRLHASLELDIDAFEYSSTDSTMSPFKGRFELHLAPEEVEPLEVFGEGINQEFEDRIFEALGEDAPTTAYVEVFQGEKPLRLAVLVSNGELTRVGRKNKAFGVTGRTLEQDVLIQLLRMPPEELPVVSVGGGAGTGKTLLTIASALEELRLHTYEKIVVFRSLHELGQGQEMGFLPGGVDEKMAPWAGAIFDAIDTLARLKKPLRKNATAVDVEKQKAEALKLREMVEISPITYLRGRSLSNTFMILEEAQNFSRSEILNILSRAGEGTKIVLTSDANQVDSSYLKSGKDADIWSVVDSLKHEDIFAHVDLTRTERSRTAEIVSSILEAGN